jgi:hypothetical protein
VDKSHYPSDHLQPMLSAMRQPRHPRAPSLRERCVTTPRAGMSSGTKSKIHTNLISPGDFG